MYTAPPPGPDGVIPDDTEKFEEFYEEVCDKWIGGLVDWWIDELIQVICVERMRACDAIHQIVDELTKFGYVEQLHVVENLGDHMFGNIYVKYSSEEEAEKAMRSLAGRYYAGDH